MFFKCKNCEGNMVYSPEKKEMFCPYCDSLKSHVRSDQGKDVLTICPNCSGEITVGEYDASGRCPYCDTYFIEMDSFVAHLEKKHPESIPPDETAWQQAYYLKTGKTEGRRGSKGAEY